MIMTIFFLAVIMAAIVSFIIPPTYEAETNLRVKQPKGLADSLLGDIPIGNVSATKQLMFTYAEILKSRTVIQEVIDKTQADKPEIPDYDDMLKRITTQPVKDTEILKVKVTAKSPEEAQLVADTVVNTFNNRMMDLVRSEQTIVRKFIGERLKESKQELEQAESNLQQYKTEQKIISPDDETKALVERLSAINTLLADNTVTAAANEARLAAARKELGLEKPGFVADSLLIQQYKGKLADLEVQMVSLTQNLTEKHPQVQATRAAIDETRNKLNAEALRIVNAEASSMNPIHQGLLQGRIQAEAELAAAGAQKAAIDGILKQGELEMSKLPTKEQGLAKFMRDVAVSQEIYVMLAKRYEEARISEVMQPTDVQVIDLANLPDEPIKPKKTLNIIIAAILGFFLGTGIAFLLEYMNKSIRTEEDVRHYLDLPVLGKIPHFESQFQAPKAGSFSKIRQFFSIGKKRTHNQ